jgi:branched-subunit amino acid transport protein
MGHTQKVVFACGSVVLYMYRMLFFAPQSEKEHTKAKIQRLLHDDGAAQGAIVMSSIRSADKLTSRPSPSP